MSDKTRNKSTDTRRLRLVDIFIIIIFLLIAAVSIELFRRDLNQTINLNNIEPIGTVVVKRNTVQRRLGDRIVWDRLGRESPVYIGDLIRIADISEATLYIEGDAINLGENTLIRILPSPDGEGLMLLLDQGSISLVMGDENRNLTLNLNGQLVIPQPGTLMRASVAEGDQVMYQEIESVARLMTEGAVREVSGTRLISPAVNSVFRYNDNLPVINFHWAEIEDAMYYVLEVSATPDFSNPQIRRQSAAPFLSDSGLVDGVWYWRVMPVFPTIFTGYSSFSTPFFFRIEQTVAQEMIEEEVPLTLWLAEEVPPSAVPEEVPKELIAIVMPEIVPPVAAPLPPPVVVTPVVTPVVTTRVTPQRQTQPQPPTLLPPVRNMRPVNGTNFGHAQLRSQRTINFSWSIAQGANAYIFALYHQTAEGRRQIVRATVNRGGYELDSLRVLDRGTFIWQVEAVSMGRGNVINRRGRVEESIFIIDFPSPGPVHIEDTGILYGN